MQNATGTIIHATGGTCENVMNRGERGLVTIVLHRSDFGYAVTTTTMGTPTSDATSARHFTDFDEAVDLYNTAVTGLRMIRAADRA